MNDRIYFLFRQVFFILTFILLSGTISAQAPVPGGDMESWSSAGGGLYEEVAGGWWATLNPLRSLGGPVTVSKSTDAHGGTYSAKLTTNTFGSLLVPGILISGEFDSGAIPDFLLTGQSWTDTPLSFKGWFKYLPVNGDSAGFAARLYRWNGSARELIAMAGMTFYDSVPTWTSFDLPFDYYLPGSTPDTIEVVCVASAGGENFLGQSGSTLYVDDLEFSGLFVANEGPVNHRGLQLWPQPAGDQLNLSLPADKKISMIQVCSLSGTVVTQIVQPSFPLDLGSLPAGAWILRCITPQGEMFSRTFTRLP